jgi:hypothetical protein
MRAMVQLPKLALARLRVGACLAAIAATACGTPGRGAAGAPGPSKPEPQGAPAIVVCLANQAGAKAKPAIDTDTHVVCDAFQRTLRPARFVGSGTPAAGAEPWSDVRTGWAPMTAASPVRILYYEGHGMPRTDCGQRAEPGSARETLCLASPRDGGRLPWHYLSTLLPSPVADLGWRALVLNSCDSGYADASEVQGPFVLVSTGLGQVPSGVTPVDLGKKQPPVESFAHLFAKALEKPAIDENCDGLVTDAELQTVVNGDLKLRAASRSSNAIVFVKRQADTDVPLFRATATSPQCAGARRIPALLGAPEAGSLPTRLVRDLGAQAELTSGSSGKLVESALRYLVVEDTRDCGPSGVQAPDETLLGIDRGLRALGFEMVRLPGTGSAAPGSFVRDLQRLARFTHVNLLTLEPVAVRLYDRSGKKILPLKADAGTCAVAGDARASARARDAALRVLRCLPRRFELVNALAGVEDLGCREYPPDPLLTDACPIVGDLQECIGVRVDGRLAEPQVQLVRWQDFITLGSDATGEALDWSSARPIPCHSGTGQCFKLTNPHRTPRHTADWLLLEGRPSSHPHDKD